MTKMVSEGLSTSRGDEAPMMQDAYSGKWAVVVAFLCAPCSVLGFLFVAYTGIPKLLAAHGFEQDDEGMRIFLASGFALSELLGPLKEISCILGTVLSIPVFCGDYTRRTKIVTLVIVLFSIVGVVWAKLELAAH